MKTRKSFTLVEILVTITCATIVLAALVSSIVFVNRMNKTALSSSSTSFKIASIEDFIRSKSNELDENSDDRFIYKDNEKSLYYDDGVEEKLLFDKMDTINVQFVRETKTDNESSIDYVVVYLNYIEKNANKVFSFVLKKAS